LIDRISPERTKKKAASFTRHPVVSRAVSPTTKPSLSRLLEKLNPFVLRKTMEEKLKKIFFHASISKLHLNGPLR